MISIVCCKFYSSLLSFWLLFFSVRIMSPVPYGLSKVVMKLMKNWIICGLLLYWRHSTWLGMLHLR